jgi:carbonic anhydrase
MLGLKAGDAKIFRNPGGRVTTQLPSRRSCSATHLLNVDRVLVHPPHELRDDGQFTERSCA